ncbi:pyruvate formate-lyase-activating protein [Clostridium mediterraneense]|uniref:pyruvate formate-lyase-activating protein n=1 Tax=Clostridium mediterraneense TaxID=1805472 RepID=UPI000835E694|nr:pyruvate formate-lyase-activating protein [Clostridium mediterraneense]
MVKGKIHSIETMGLVDGPGIRFVAFMQGCAIRCAYCHNPDTWTTEGGQEYTPRELVDKIKRYKPYFNSSGGGVTFSGGEPLLQPEFLLETLKLCKEEGIHTTLDTAGVGFGNYKEILKYTDLVMFDIKHLNKDEYEKLVGKKIDKSLEFLNECQESGVKMWIRHVVVPGITDSRENIQKVKEFVDTLKNVEKVELLPYHVLGVNKYETMGIKYKLEGVKPMDKDLLNEMKKEIFK